ncbi:hypothetical protein ASF20_13765 [Methylobacterium sp. Leaf88]|nr:hypothetical protein ASF20_13765 [Methylobacterium sp. Leaf88]
MPRYFLDVGQTQGSTSDDAGTVLPNEAAGRCLALDTLAQIATRSIQGNDQQSWFASVRDDQGNTLYRAKLTLSGRWEDEGR